MVRRPYYLVEEWDCYWSSGPSLMLCTTMSEITWRWRRSNLSPFHFSASFDDPPVAKSQFGLNPYGDNIICLPPQSPISSFSSHLIVVLFPNHHIVISLTEQSLITFIRSIIEHHSLYSPGWLQYSYTYTTKLDLSTK